MMKVRADSIPNNGEAHKKVEKRAFFDTKKELNFCFSRFVECEQPKLWMDRKADKNNEKFFLGEMLLQIAALD
jgi:hypothetical protein